jgi:hypothetical protein
MLFFNLILTPHGLAAQNGQRARLAAAKTYVMLPTLAVQRQTPHQPWAKPGFTRFFKVMETMTNVRCQEIQN